MGPEGPTSPNPFFDALVSLIFVSLVGWFCFCCFFLCCLLCCWSVFAVFFVLGGVFCFVLFCLFVLECIIFSFIVALFGFCFVLCVSWSGRGIVLVLLFIGLCFVICLHLSVSFQYNFFLAVLVLFWFNVCSIFVYHFCFWLLFFFYRLFQDVPLFLFSACCLVLNHKI